MFSTMMVEHLADAQNRMCRPDAHMLSKQITADGSVQGQGPWDQTNKLSVES